MMRCHTCGAEPRLDPTYPQMAECPDCGQRHHHGRCWNQAQVRRRASHRWDLIHSQLRGGKPVDVDAVEALLKAMFKRGSA